ncbi:hypothetical protein ZWY2020_010186 [Hordeum vulgare]|nr:hypothetical protein ZWY2020_010186 [Hordeum vulgare]
MSKRRSPSSSSEAEHDRNCACACTCTGTAKRPRPQPEQRHLYVALDDRNKVYSVYKLNVDAGDGDGDGDGSSGSVQRLPEPPVLRLEVPKRRDTCLFAALDAKIIALCADRSPTLVHDTHAAALAVGHRPSRALARASFTVPAAGRLYALPPRFTEDTYYLEPEEMAVRPDGEKMIIDKWVWNQTDCRSPVPFDPRAITCHAVHPDGRTVFVSVRRRHKAAWLGHGTFSLDAGSRGAEWTHHGDWMLPFKGRAFFEPRLDAWVGLDEDGRICSCNGMSRSRSRRAPPPAKVAKETLLRVPDPGRRLDATLAHMGDARFCLVERASHEGCEAVNTFDDDDACALHVTTFAIRYDSHGDLTVADLHHAGSYVVSTHDAFFTLQAFFL